MKSTDWALATAICLLVVVLAFLSGVLYGVRWYDRDYLPGVLPERCEEIGR